MTENIAYADVADVSVANIGEEAFSEILARPGLKIERIISQGQTSPPGFWYDQATNRKNDYAVSTDVFDSFT